MLSATTSSVGAPAVAGATIAAPSTSIVRRNIIVAQDRIRIAALLPD
jgi:hypothetical protein